jgi:hypothetical protein
MIKNTIKVMQDVTDLTAVLLGVPSDSIKGGSRAKKLVLGRMVSANFLIIDLNYDYEELGKHIDRDRTSFYYYEHKHKEYYEYWEDYTELYDKLKVAYLGKGTTALTSEYIKDIFLKNGIVNMDAAPFMIGFKIGKVEEFIYTRELEATITLLQSAFKQFNYSFSVEHINSWSYES